MAYTFIPTSTEEISAEIKDAKSSAEFINIFKFLVTKFPHIPDPIAIDKSKLKTCKVTRSLQSSIEEKEIQKQATTVKVSFGSGSRGGRGSENKGNKFEEILTYDIMNWWKGEPISDASNAPILESLAETYKFKELKDLTAIQVGGKNTPRPISFTNNILIGRGITNIGEDVSDVDLKSGDKIIAHLSLKHGGTVTFFNVGTMKTIIKDEIKKGVVVHKDGIKLLNLLGIENERMCNIFNGISKARGKETVTSKIDKEALSKFIQSGIGYGFHMVHKIGPAKYKCFYVDEQYMKAASTVSSVTVHYGGKTGTGKRVDIEIETTKYILKMNIRDSTGNNAGYPTRLMCDYSYK